MKFRVALLASVFLLSLPALAGFPPGKRATLKVSKAKELFKNQIMTFEEDGRHFEIRSCGWNRAPIFETDSWFLQPQRETAELTGYPGDDEWAWVFTYWDGGQLEARDEIGNLIREATPSVESISFLVWELAVPPVKEAKATGTVTAGAPAASAIETAKVERKDDAKSNS